MTGNSVTGASVVGASVPGASVPGASVLDEPPSEPQAARASAAISKTGANLPLVILFIFFLPRVGLGSTDVHTLVATRPLDEQRAQDVHTAFTKSKDAQIRGVLGRPED
ncbi:unannotated protein [freshwater metagenome]|uniref:Unannotated protein n=1 Tax=freshwater metagenome TaxID=449393 RepID=A0A6J6GSB1_9ZZZZ